MFEYEGKNDSILIKFAHGLLGMPGYFNTYNLVGKLFFKDRKPRGFMELHILCWFGLIFLSLLLMQFRMILPGQILFSIFVALATIRLLGLGQSLLTFVFVEESRKLITSNPSAWTLTTFSVSLEIIQCFAFLFLWKGELWSPAITNP